MGVAGGLDPSLENELKLNSPHVKPMLFALAMVSAFVCKIFVSKIAGVLLPCFIKLELCNGKIVEFLDTLKVRACEQHCFVLTSCC